MGAGASTDFIHHDNQVVSDDLIPPLANDLFNKRFESIISQFKEMRPLPGNIATALRQGISLEAYLQDVKKIAATNEDRQRQLIALEFYLQKLFYEISLRFGSQSGNNYDSLVGYINDYIHTYKEKVHVVSFNYDTLFEQSLPSKYSFKQAMDYLNNDISIYKVHGSWNWKYILPDLTGWIREAGGSYPYMMESPWSLTHQPKEYFEGRDLIITDSLSYNDTYGDREYYYCPAIAVPLPGKDSFICPPSHVQMLQTALGMTDNILIIGWKAGDQALIEMIKQFVNIPAKITIASRNSGSAIEDVLSGKGNLTFTTTQHTLSTFLGSKECLSFFKLN